MKISIIFECKSDLDFFKDVEPALKKNNIDYEVQVISAHRDLLKLVKYIREVEKNQIKIIIAVASYSAALPGVIAGITDVPVIGVPISSSPIKLDALLSIVQMPKGNPVACVSYDQAGLINAILFALRILSLLDKNFIKKIEDFKKELNISS